MKKLLVYGCFCFGTLLGCSSNTNISDKPTTFFQREGTHGAYLGFERPTFLTPDQIQNVIEDAYTLTFDKGQNTSCHDAVMVAPRTQIIPTSVGPKEVTFDNPAVHIVSIGLSHEGRLREVTERWSVRWMCKESNTERRNFDLLISINTGGSGHGIVTYSLSPVGHTHMRAKSLSRTYPL